MYYLADLVKFQCEFAAEMVKERWQLFLVVRQPEMRLWKPHEVVLGLLAG